MPKITLELTESQVKLINSQMNDPNLLTPEDKSLLHEGIREHDCIFKDDFEFYRLVENNFPFMSEKSLPTSNNKAFYKFVALHRIKKYIHDNDLEFRPDWDNTDQWKCYIDFDYRSKSFKAYQKIINQLGFLYILPYFRSIPDAEKVIENCKSDLDILRS